MRTSIHQQTLASRSWNSQNPASLSIQAPLFILGVAAALFGTQLLFAPMTLAAQTPQATTAPATTHKKPHSHAAHPVAKPAQVAPVAVAPPAPEPPRWPANDKPVQASVTWDSQGLRIDATNSSLQQILQDVATATGAKVEGLAADERVFGAYGPGVARDVLSQLLQGTGYNVLMIGDQGQGTPRQIVLSSRRGGDTASSANKGSAGNGDDEAADNEVDDQPQPAPPLRPGFSPGGAPRTPQQIM
jgi:hypothetical protein